MILQLRQYIDNSNSFDANQNKSHPHSSENSVVSDNQSLLKCTVTNYTISSYLACKNTECRNKAVTYNESGLPYCQSCTDNTKTHYVKKLNVVISF